MQITDVTPVVRPLRGPSIGLFGLIGHWMRVARERDRLARLNQHMLRDIGLTQAEAECEAGRPFWDASRR
ncbi:MAG: DUF1127 domain-containing protein [Pseudomonadota bacterium]